MRSATYDGGEKIPKYTQTVYIDTRFHGDAAINIFINGNYDNDILMVQLNGATMRYGTYSTWSGEYQRDRMAELPTEMKTDIVDLKENVVEYVDLDELNDVIDSIKDVLSVEKSKLRDNRYYDSEFESLLRISQKEIDTYRFFCNTLSYSLRVLKLIRKKFYTK